MAEKSAEPVMDDWVQRLETPYVHWWRTREQPRLERSDPSNKYANVRIPRSTYAGLFDDEVSLQNVEEFTFPTLESHLNPLFSPSSENTPRWIDNTSLIPEQFLQDLEYFADLSEDTVLVGLIDVGIPLAHDRTRYGPDKKTRFLASWQQAVRFVGNQPLPFGNELYAADIDRLIRTHTHDGYLDEDAFNRAAGLVDYDAARGARDLEQRASHGAHVLDLAAGYDPASRTAKDVRIISVNLPPERLHGVNGNFLVHFALPAVLRILFLASAFWHLRFPGKPGGFPLAINFSFGRRAGPKAGDSSFEKIVQSFVNARTNNIAKTHLVMPVGNQNLSRGNARIMMGTSTTGKIEDPATGYDVDLEQSVELPWAILPEDQTPNFLEIWGNVLSTAGRNHAKPEKFCISVKEPGADLFPPAPTLKAGQYYDFANGARVYCYAPIYQRRPHFVVVVPSTLDFVDPKAEAIAGEWGLQVQYAETAHEIGIGVQTDQLGTPSTEIAGVSYFRHAKYETHDEEGRLVDSYKELNNKEPWDTSGPVQRKGTQNSLATWAEVIVIGGFRESDKRPSLFSSTFDGNKRRRGGLEQPTALYPAETSPSHFGLLGSGSKSGSVVTFQGTSMATALATRHLTSAMRARTPINSGWFTGQVDGSARQIFELKGGAGIVRPPRHRNPPRHGGN